MTIPGDLRAIEHIIGDHDVRLVIVDVLMAYLSGDVNAHRDQDVRLALHLLAAMAERSGCCIIVLRHLNKSPGGNAVYRGGGQSASSARPALASCAAPTPTTKLAAVASSPVK